MNKLFAYILVAVMGALLSSPTKGSAEIVYDNGESQWSQGTGWSCGAEIGAYIAADDFVLDSNRTITGVSVDVSERTEPPSRQWDGTVEWWMLSDNSGSPGTVIASGRGGSIAVDILDDGLFSRNLAVEFDLCQRVPLLGGTRYWLALHFRDDYETIGVGWECSVLGQSNDLHYSGGELIDGAPWFPDDGNPYTFFDQTFRLISKKMVNVPVKVCAVEGSTAAEGNNTDAVLLQRLNRATEIWGRCAGIKFQSAMPAGTDASFPVISDPDPELGPLGAIRDPNVSKEEMNDATANCDAAWDELGISQGLVMVNIERIVNQGGFVLPDKWGRGGNYYHYSGSENPACTEDLSRLTSNDGYAFVIDNSYTGNQDPSDKTLAHELGHALYLGHGDGRDNDNDGPYDSYCDSDEDVYASPYTIMHPRITTATKEITGHQKNTARGFAEVTPGYTTSASKAQPGDTRGDYRTDAAHDVSDESIDIVSAGIVENVATGTSVFFHSLFDIIPLSASNQYLILADFDDDPLTGGSPSILGFATAFAGAEIVTRVTVTPDSLGTFRLVIPTLWRFEAGAFEEISDPQIQASVGAKIEAETGVSLSDVVSIQLPSTMLGIRVTEARIQAIAEQMTTGELDRLPDKPLEGGLTISMIPPEYPDCVATPLQVKPGEYLTVEASGLIPGKVATVFLGDQQVGETSVDSEGTAVATFLVPYPTAAGSRLVSLAVTGSAISAGDLVEIQESTNIPPVADAGDNIRRECTSPSGVFVTLDGSRSSDPDGDLLQFKWSAPGVQFDDPTSVTPTGQFPTAQTVADLTVSDGVLEDADTTIVDIIDSTSPTITLNGPSQVTLECALESYVEQGASAFDLCDDQLTTATVGGDTVNTSMPGTYNVTYSAVDASGNQTQTLRQVDVVDTTPPEIECNTPSTLVPPDALASFTANAEDACGSAVPTITEFDCFTFTKKGKRIDKTESCVASVEGDTITILGSGGVGDHITWSVAATDDSGNASTELCEVVVANPGRGR